MDEKGSGLKPMELDRPSRFLALAQENGGTRLDLFLATELALSRAQVRRLLDSGAVALDGRQLGLADKGLALPAQGVLEVRAYRVGRDQVVSSESTRRRGAANSGSRTGVACSRQAGRHARSPPGRERVRNSPFLCGGPRPGHSGSG